ncbi:MAG: dynamin family protein [Rhodospirillales bacterium]|nr:dynamin family protein [Rhodospirillales bacterium]
MDLRQYGRMKTALAEVLRGATMAERPGPRREAARALFSRLAEDRFNLVVVGRFSRGKSTLMNAMLGTDRLPTGIVPVTSVITTVSYGSEERVVLHYQHTSLFMDIPIAELASHITERGNPGNVRRIRTAEVQLPAELLRRGFYFIDTPGLGSSIAENTRTTEGFLSEADAFVLVTSYESPLSEEEARILELVRQSGRRAFVVVNKEDGVDEGQRREVLEHLAGRLEAIFGAAAPSVFSLSAMRAERARIGGDAAGVAASGLPALEAALVEFLINEKRRAFLLAMCGRAEGVLEPGDVVGRARLGELRVALAAVRPAEEKKATAIAPASVVGPAIGACEVCASVSGAVFQYLAAQQYQLGGEEKLRAAFEERGGLCGPHTWQFEAMTAPKEVATSFPGVLERQAGRLRRVAASGGEAARQVVAAALPTAASCGACEVARQAAGAAVAAVAGRLQRDPEGALKGLSAVCLPHLAALVGALSKPEVVKAVLLREAELMERLAEDMRGYALKRDGMQRHLTSKEEAMAGERGLRVLLGDPRAALGPEPAIGNVTALPRRAG